MDNIIFRLGISPTRRAARQLVLHKHITVNGDIVNIPSFSVRVGDMIAVRERSKSLEVVTDSLASNIQNRFPWLEWDGSELSGKVVAIPQRDEIPENINEQLIVELYSK